MTITDYLIDIALVALVLLQIRDRRQDLRSLLLPTVGVIVAGLYYLKGVPTTGHDLLLEVLLGAVGALLGAGDALTTRVWRAEDGFVHNQAGGVAAILWIVGLGSRFVFSEYATHGGEASIARFSAAHAITSDNAWVAALVFMAIAEVVVRLVVLRFRGASARRPAGPDVAPAAVSAGRA